MWPIFFSDKLIQGNPKSNVAICTLWSKAENVAKRVPKEYYNVVGNLYTCEGINYIVKNVLANPVITHIIICGTDLNKSGDALLNFAEKGLDENLRISGTESYMHKNIPLGLIRTFRENVKVVRSKEAELASLAKQYYSPIEPFTQQVEIPDETEAESELTTDLTGFRVEGTLKEVWLTILDLIFKYGENKASQQSFGQKEILNVLAVINGGFDVSDIPWIDKKDADIYINNFFGGSDKDIEYTYGERLLRYSFKHISEQFSSEFNFYINQIDGIVKTMQGALHSRRAVASLWNPFTDLSVENPPCLTQIMWIIRNNKLYQTCTFRSHDVFGAYLLNALALRKLQERTAEKLNVGVGDLTILSHSAHAYKNTLVQAKKLIEQHKYKSINFGQDKAGYFRLWLEDGEIHVQHYLNDGRKTQFFFKGLDAITLYRRMLAEGIFTKLDHAAYLGKELARAEHCLKNGLQFEQDKA